MRLDPNQPLSLRGLNKTFSSVGQQSNLTAGGLDLETSIGNPLFTTPPQRERYVTARITGIAYQSDGTTPLLTDSGALQYTWIQELRSANPGSTPAWVNSTDAVRQSVMLAPGSYLNLAREANDGQVMSANVILWATINVIQSSGQSDHEHLFFSESQGWAVATGDWVMGAYRTSGDLFDHITVQRCINANGDSPYGSAFTIVFLKRADLDPAIFAGDVIRYELDFGLPSKYWNVSMGSLPGYITTPDAYDDKLGCVKDFWTNGAALPIPAGWHECDGSAPGGTKIGTLPDSRGLFGLPLDVPGGKWTDAGSEGPLANINGALVSHASATKVGPDSLVDEVEDVETWAGAPVNPPDTSHFVCRPPSFVWTRIIRWK